MWSILFYTIRGETKSEKPKKKNDEVFRIVNCGNY